MTILIRDIKFDLSQDERDKAELFSIAARRLKIDQKLIKNCKITRMSLDARKKTDIHHKITLAVDLFDELKNMNLIAQDANISKVEEKPDEPIVFGKEKLSNRPVIVGSGPCGMFAAVWLAKNGYCPIVLERGKNAGDRTQDVNHFWQTGKLNPASNALFGEGGAGTFSDGKLTSRSKDPRSAELLQWFVDMGAPSEILYLAKPHVGTDNLKRVVENIRRYVESKGGKYYFETCVTDVEYSGDKISTLITNNPDLPRIDTNACIFAIGHSARDTYEMLFKRDMEIIAKPFAVGVRIEHQQTMINQAQFGGFASARLGAAEYALTTRQGNRNIYSFCMCPGGSVISCSSEEGQVVTNGMSKYDRGAQNANSALVVAVNISDFENQPLGGIAYQRALEKKAFEVGGKSYFAPAQRVSDFLKQKPTKSFAKNGIRPSYAPGVTGADLWQVLPEPVSQGIALALPKFGNQIKGFDHADAVLTGVETRTSAPVRIVRNELLQSTRKQGIYPAGEGAGYAGGIMSAALDGVRCAVALMQRFAPCNKNN